MRSFNFIAWIAILVLVAFTIPSAQAEAEVKRVCHEEKGKQTESLPWSVATIFFACQGQRIGLPLQQQKVR